MKAKSALEDRLSSSTAESNHSGLPMTCTDKGLPTATGTTGSTGAAASALALALALDEGAGSEGALLAADFATTEAGTLAAFLP